MKRKGEGWVGYTGTGVKTSVLGTKQMGGYHQPGIRRLQFRGQALHCCRTYSAARVVLLGTKFVWFFFRTSTISGCRHSEVQHC